MLIAIDFDDTLTRDPALWLQFIASARSVGHRVACVTARRPTDENKADIGEWMKENSIELPVYFTALGSKVEWMAARGHMVDIWIDDDPRKCALGH